MRPREQHHAAVARGEFVARQARRALAGLGQQHARSPSSSQPSSTQALLSAAQEGRQRGRVDAGQRQAFAAGSSCRRRGGAFGQLDRQAPVAQRQRRRQRGARGGLAVQAAQLDQAVEQRIQVDQVFAQAQRGALVAGAVSWGVAGLMGALGDQPISTVWKPN